MWRLWLAFDPRKALVGLAVFLFSLAILIHFILWSTERYNIFEGAPVASLSIEQSHSDGLNDRLFS